MADKWENFLLEGKFKGIRFDFVQTQDAHRNVLDKQEFPNRNGAAIKKRGRGMLNLTVMAIFVEDDYPEVMNDLITKLDDGEPGELVHPVFGTIQAAAETFNVTHDAEDADSGTIQIQFVEHTKNVDKVFDNAPTTAGKASSTRSSALDVITTAEEYKNAVLNTIVVASGIAVAIVSEPFRQASAIVDDCIIAANAVASVADVLEEEGESMSALEVQARSNSALAKVEAQVEILADYEIEQAYTLSRALLDTASALQDLATLLINAKPPLTIHVVEADIPLLALAHALGAVIDDLIALNSFADPLLIEAGTHVRCYAA